MGTANVNAGNLSEEAVLAAVARTPTLRPILVRMVRRATQGAMQPATVSASSLDYAAQGELERLLGLVLRRGRDGRVSGPMPSAWRTPSAWQGVAAALGMPWGSVAAESLETFWARLGLLAPDETEWLAALSEMPEVVHHVRVEANREIWQKLFLGVAGYVREGALAPTTLSQLGATWLNDSKALRSGPLRRQLAILLAALCGRDIDERSLFGTYGIFDNPYTSFVTVFAPFVFTTEDGTSFDFPERLYEAGQACVLASETVGRIRSVTWHGPLLVLTTSENAAPFAQYVAARRSALYTEGYPNLAVQRLLSLFGAAGVAAEHAGDADLDGFRIADMVARRLVVSRVMAADVVRDPQGLKGIPLTAAQRLRMERFLSANPAMPHADVLRQLLERDCWYEQESFPATERWVSRPIEPDFP